MTTPEPAAGDDRSESTEQTTEQSDVPPTAPAYSTPPPEGLPDAETS